MTRTYQTELVRFRADQRLLEKAQAKANDDGMTLSELIRQALREFVTKAA